MNQILVTEKLYVTPELRRKKKLYKLQFFFCVFLACMLFSYYIYAEYDRAKSEEVSQEILMGIRQEKQVETAGSKTNREENKTDTTVRKMDNILVIELDDEEEPAEIPEEVVEQQPSTIEYETQAGVKYTVEATVRVPRLGIDYPVLSETSEELLKISVNKYWGPSAPNQVGNYCIVGHNYKSKKMFGRLSEMVSGDIIELEDMNKNVVKYSVYDKFTVDPTDTSCTSQLTNGRREVTLITCTNYGTQRLVVKATEIK